MTYLIAPTETLELDKWRDAMDELIKTYSHSHCMEVSGLGEDLEE